MTGAIAGDIIGSVFEWDNIKIAEFPLFCDKSKFTDDTVLTIAVADCILNAKGYAANIKLWGRKYPGSGYGGNFTAWLARDGNEPYNSWGNGSAMRVSPVGFAFESLEDVLNEAKKSAEVTHNHPEGIKGAQAVASTIFLARSGAGRREIKEFVEKEFSYDLSRTLDAIRPSYTFDVSCQGSVPEAIIAFLESENFEDAIRKAVSLGGDSDTIACITGGIAHAFYGGVSDDIVSNVRKRLPADMLDVLDKFSARYRL